MKDIKDLTVYTTFSKRGITRMALHSMDHAPEDFGYKNKAFHFRVVYNLASMYNYNTHWKYSCLGAGTRKYNDSYRFGTRIKQGTNDDALKWLVEGEK